MAEKKPAAKKPAAKAPAKKPAAAPAAPAKTPLRASETRTSGQFDASGVELSNADAGKIAGEVILRPAGATRGGKTKAANQKLDLPSRPIGSVRTVGGQRVKLVKGEGVDTKELAKFSAETDAAIAAKKLADRTRKGASATIDAPAPRKFKTGRVAKASAVKETAAKRTPSARKVQRDAQAAAAEAATRPVEKTASDYLGAAERQVKEIVPVWHSPASDLLTRFSNTPHTRTMKLVSAIDAKIGYNGENLPSSISPEVRQEVSARMASVKESHNRAYHAAITGDPVASLQRAHEAHETLQSVGYILSQDPEANKTRALSVARDIVAPIKQHGDIVKRALSDQKKNMSIETTDPQWKTADSVMGLRNEKTTVKEGPYAGLRPAKDFRTPDARNSRRGHAIFPTIKTLVTTAMNHSADPRDQMHAERLLQTARGFGGAVESGDRTAAVNLGQQTLMHLSALHNSVRNQLNSRYPAGYLGNRVVNLYANTLAQHHDIAADRIKEILGEK
jgi:hypothetical protein